MISSCSERFNNHMGTEKRPTVGSSGESWSISGSLNWHFTEMIFEEFQYEGREVVKLFQKLIL